MLRFQQKIENLGLPESTVSSLWSLSTNRILIYLPKYREIHCTLTRLLIESQKRMDTRSGFINKVNRKSNPSAVTRENVIGSRFFRLFCPTIKKEMFCLPLTSNDLEQFPSGALTIPFLKSFASL